MLAALLLSMWMSNTTATAMMMPIAEAVLAQLRLQEGGSQIYIFIRVCWINLQKLFH